MEEYVKNIVVLDMSNTYSYTDYLLWQFEEKVELVRGKIFKMPPAPNMKHQQISWQKSGLFFNYFAQHTYSAFSALFDVRLYDNKKSQKTNKEIYTIVQPDLCVICDKSKLDEQGCIGAPDLIIEILSNGCFSTFINK